MCLPTGQSVDLLTLVEPTTEGLELRDAPCQKLQLVQVAIEYSDLGVDNEGITLFADATSTARLVSRTDIPEA